MQLKDTQTPVMKRIVPPPTPAAVALKALGLTTVQGRVLRELFTGPLKPPQVLECNISGLCGFYTTYSTTPVWEKILALWEEASNFASVQAGASSKLDFREVMRHVHGLVNKRAVIGIELDTLHLPLRLKPFAKLVSALTRRLNREYYQELGGSTAETEANHTDQTIVEMYEALVAAS